MIESNKKLETKNEEKKQKSGICQHLNNVFFTSILILIPILIISLALFYREYIFNLLLSLSNSFNLDTIIILLITYFTLTILISFLLLCIYSRGDGNLLFLKKIININKDVLPFMMISTSVIFTISSILDFPGANKKDIFEYIVNSFISNSIPATIVLLTLIVFYFSFLSGIKIVNAIKETTL
ncbi:hypothetical protein I4674_19260 [Proteus mirabilis]|nr:hypothetical protein [Proteus mirabilis]